MVENGINGCPSGLFSSLSPRQHIVPYNCYSTPTNDIRDKRYQKCHSPIRIDILVRAVVGVSVPIEAAARLRIRHHRINAEEPPRKRIIVPLLHVHERRIVVVHMPREPDRARRARHHVAVGLVARPAQDRPGRVGLRHRTAQRIGMVVGDGRAGDLGQHVVAQVDVFRGRAAAGRDVQQLAVLGVHLHPRHPVGADHTHPSPEAIVGVGRLAHRPLQAVAQVVLEYLPVALRDVAAHVVAVADVEARRAAGDAVQAVGRRVDVVDGGAGRDAAGDRGAGEVVQRVVAIGGAAHRFGALAVFSRSRPS